MKTTDKYLFQALDNYPYWLEGTIESLDYAISYNDKDSMAFCLYGRIQAEQLYDYETAKDYFQQALAIDIQAVEVYPHYINTLILNEDYAEAQKSIDFSLTIRGINKVDVLFKKLMLLEKQGEYKHGLKVLNEIRLAVCNNNYTSDIDEAEKRLKAKKALLSNKDKSKTKKSKKK